MYLWPDRRRDKATQGVDILHTLHYELSPESLCAADDRHAGVFFPFPTPGSFSAPFKFSSHRKTSSLTCCLLWWKDVENEITLISLRLLNYTSGGGHQIKMHLQRRPTFLIQMQIPSALGWCNKSNPVKPSRHTGMEKPRDPHFACYLFSLLPCFLLHWTLTIDKAQTIHRMLLTTAEGHSCSQTDRSTCLNQRNHSPTLW